VLINDLQASSRSENRQQSDTQKKTATQRDERENVYSRELHGCNKLENE
jgi:hypothetical protein